MEAVHQLTEAEWAFQITKDELAIRPIWHQKEELLRKTGPGATAEANFGSQVFNVG